MDDSSDRTKQADIISIFDGILRRVKKDIRLEGPQSISYLCAKYGAEVLLQMLEKSEEFTIHINDGQAVVHLGTESRRI